MKKTYFATIILLLFIGCSTVPLTGRKQLKLLPESTLLEMSFSQYNTFLSESKVVTNSDEAKMVKSVGNKLAAGATEYLKANGYGDRLEEYQWEFNLVQDNTVNAWCMPGGKVAVYTGIMPTAQGEAGLAVVMGHEIAHAIARHGNERMSQMMAVEMGGMALDVAMIKQAEETRALFMTAYSIGSTVGVILPYSRKHESEADKMGLVFMAKAGYDPHEAVDFWKRMSAQGGQSPPEWLSTHPSDETRINRLKNYIPEAMKYYKP